MTRKEKQMNGREFYKKAMKLCGKAFDGEGNMNELKVEVNKFWYDVEQAEKNGEIYKVDANLVYKNLKEAFRWIHYHYKKVNA